MDAIIKMLELNITPVILGVFIIMAGIIAAWTIIGKFLELIGKPVKWFSSKSKDHEELKQLVQELKDHKDNNDKVEKTFIKFMNEMKLEMKKYNDNRIHDRQQSFDIQRQLTSSIEKMANSADSNKDLIDALLVAQKEMMAEKINEKYKNYIAMDGIPEDEYDEFVTLHKAYKGVGGNHHGDAKFKYCKEHLKIIPVKTKIITMDYANEKERE